MDFTGISRRADRWLHVQIADVIEASIRAGELSPGEMLPAERALSQESGASREAVRRALAVLRRRGVVYTRRDIGSFVETRIPPREPG